MNVTELIKILQTLPPDTRVSRKSGLYPLYVDVSPKDVYLKELLLNIDRSGGVPHHAGVSEYTREYVLEMERRGHLRAKALVLGE